MGSTEDSGPMKPGNSVEDKTLTTGKQREDQGRADAGFGNLEEDPDRREIAIRRWEVMDERRE